MALLNYSVTLVPGTNENVLDVETKFNEVRSAVNGIDNSNVIAGANIDWSKINAPAHGIAASKVAIANGKILRGDASGNGAEVTPGGAVAAISSAGVFTSRFYFDENNVGGINVAGGYTNICTIQLTVAGTYIVWGKCLLYTTGGSAQEMHSRLLLGLGPVDQATSESSQFNMNQEALAHMKVMAVSANDVVILQAGGLMAGGSMTCGDARLFALRVG